MLGVFGRRNRKMRGDFLLLIAVWCVVGFGLVMIYSASNYSANADYGDPFFFVKKQAIGALLGGIGMTAFAVFDYQKMQKWAWWAIALSIVLLALVFVPFLGVKNYGAKRWIKVGPITLQPSEIAKFGFIIFTASYVAKYPQKIKTFTGVLPVLGAGGIICVLIMLEPNMSITMCMGTLMLAMLFSAGMKIRHFSLILLPALALVPILIIIEPYRLNRLSAFLNPWASPKGEGYQLLQSLYALGSGGWFGVGIFHSRQKFEFLPFSESDFILSVIGEEVGFIGCLFLFTVLGFIVYRGLKIAAHCDNLFGRMLATGISMIFGVQVMVNALVVTGSIPPTGLPLPFISCGNTSLIVFLSGMGILYNVSRQNNEWKLRRK